MLESPTTCMMIRPIDNRRRLHACYPVTVPFRRHWEFDGQVRQG